MELQNPDFDKRAYLKKLESIVYVFLALPLLFFFWVYLERESADGLRTVFFKETDWLFHGSLLAAILFVFYYTSIGWKKRTLKKINALKALDEKLMALQKPLIVRNLLWIGGCILAAGGLYFKGDMIYAIVFTAFLILITANRPSGSFFVKLLRLKGEEKKWMEG